MSENNDMGACPAGTGLSPTVEPLRVSPPDGASIPSAEAWRTDSPSFGSRPIWQYVFLQGSRDHMRDGMPWARAGWGTAAIRPNDHPDSLLGYRKSDIERICRDSDIDLWTAKLVGWLPMTPPALLTEYDRPALAPCDDGEWAAQAIEARRAETGTGSVHESAVGNADAPNSQEGD